MKKIIKFLFYSFFFVATSLVPSYGARDFVSNASLNTGTINDGIDIYDENSIWYVNSEDGLWNIIDKNRSNNIDDISVKNLLPKRIYDTKRMLISSSCDNFSDSGDNITSCVKSYSYLDENSNTVDSAFEHTYMNFAPGKEQFNIQLQSEGSLIGYNTGFIDLKPGYNSVLGNKVYEESDAFIEGLLIEENFYSYENKDTLSIMKSAMVSTRDGMEDEIFNFYEIKNNSFDFSYDTYGVDMNTNGNNIFEVFDAMEFGETGTDTVVYSNNFDFYEGGSTINSRINSGATRVINLEDTVEYSDDNFGEVNFSGFNPVTINFNEENVSSYILLNPSSSKMYPDIGFVSKYGTDYYSLLD